MICSVWDANLWFRVPDHPEFDPQKVYRAVAISDYSESATGQVWLVTERGYLWAVPQSRCICVNPPWREADAYEVGYDLPGEPPRADHARAQKG